MSDPHSRLVLPEVVSVHVGAALAMDQGWARVDHLLEALASLRGNAPSAVAQCSMWYLPMRSPTVMQRVRGRYLVRGEGLNDRLLGHLFSNDMVRWADPAVKILRDRLAASPDGEIVGDYESLCTPEVWARLKMHRQVTLPLGFHNGFTDYWTVDKDHCLNMTLWVSNRPDFPRLEVREVAEVIFRLGRPLLERMFFHDRIGRAMASLTERQADVLRLLLAGHSESALARTLHRSVHTIHTHIRELYRLFRVQSRAELMAQFIDMSAFPDGPSGVRVIGSGEPEGREG